MTYIYNKSNAAR